MKKIGIIIAREYNTRVKKKSFIILTLLMPLFMAAIMFLPAYLATLDDKEERAIGVYDASGLILGRLDDSEYTKFKYIPESEYDNLKQDVSQSTYYALLFIPPNIVNSNSVQLISNKNITIDVKNKVERNVRDLLEKDKRAEVLKQAAIPDLEQRLAATKTRIKVKTIKLGESGKAEKSSTEVAMVVGYLFGFLIYMFIFLYGQQVMRGVMEEKQNRIVEVIISSVKPFELMMGKIVGIALVGLTQFAIWVVLTIGLVNGAKGLFLENSPQPIAQNLMEGQVQAAPSMSEMGEIFSLIDTINFPLIIGCFFFFFIGGYLLYASLMGAVGSAIDAEEDAQQFMLPVSMPLIIAIVVMMNAITNPEGPLAFWFSMIPFTSPIVMMVRIPYGVPVWELALSMGLLIITFVSCVWVAAKIYRTGILMYGKKPSWKELAKWLTYKS